MKQLVRIAALSLVAVMLCGMLTACGAPAKDPADAKAALEKADYTILESDTALPIAFKVLGYDLSSVVTATKTSKNDNGDTVIDHVTIFYFADKDNATKAMEKVKEQAKNDKKEADDTNWVEPTQSGSMIYYGTKAAIKAAK